MRKIFKYLYGTTGSGVVPWGTSNSGATSSIVSNTTSTSLPNYKTLALVNNILTMNTYLPKLTNTLINSMITNPSKNPILSTILPITLNGVTDTSPGVKGKSTGHKLLAENTGPSKSTKIGNTISLVAGIVSSIMPLTPQSEFTGMLDQGFNTATGLVSMASPLAGGIMAGVGAATDLARAFGLGTDLVTKADLILDSKLLALTPIGLANSLGAKRAKTINKGLDYLAIRADLGAGYGSAMSALDTAEKYAGKKIGNLFGLRDSAEAEINKGNYRLALLERIWDKASINRAIQGTLSDMAFNKENLAMQGGWQDGAITFGRHGMIITPARMRMLRTIKQNLKLTVQEELEVQAFKNGGSFNVIPEGALHARLHHMEDADGLTKKGIPVVVEKEGGEFEQQAEIELNEIIFRLEVTSEIEKLMKDGSDNAAIECGKMLVKEIFENTQDRTGLIESLEEPKEGQEEVVKEHRVFQEGGKTERQRKYKTYEDLVKYLSETGRGSDEDYDLQAAYNDPEVYFEWEDKENKNPGKGHWIDKYKKDTHVTYSNESILGENPKKNGGTWSSYNGHDLFITTPFLEERHPIEHYMLYFKDEPITYFIYKGQLYKNHD